jgi:hypothetical protein
MAAASPNPLTSLLVIIEIELTRLFLTQRGLIYLLTFGVIWFLVLRYFIMNFSAQAPLTGGWNTPELAVYWPMALYAFPILSLFSAANQTTSDRERGTLRFLTLRCSRDGVFFGRFLSQVLIQCILVTLTVASTVAAANWRDSSLLTPGLYEGCIIIVNLLVVLLPFTAMMALLSATINSVRQVTLVAVLIWLMASGAIGLLSNYWPVLDSLQAVIPGYQLPALTELYQVNTFSLIHIPVLQALGLLVLGRFTMMRSSL